MNFTGSVCNDLALLPDTQSFQVSKTYVMMGIQMNWMVPRGSNKNLRLLMDPVPFVRLFVHRQTPDIFLLLQLLLVMPPPVLQVCFVPLGTLFLEWFEISLANVMSDSAHNSMLVNALLPHKRCFLVRNFLVNFTMVLPVRRRLLMKWRKTAFAVILLFQWSQGIHRRAMLQWSYVCVSEETLGGLRAFLIGLQQWLRLKSPLNLALLHLGLLQSVHHYNKIKI